MSSLKRLDRKVEVHGISASEASKRFDYFLSKEFQASKIEDKGSYVVMHSRVRLPNRENLDVIVYTTDTIYLSTSPFVPKETFDSLATRIVQLAQQSTKSLEEIRPLTLLRARGILESASKLNLDDEFDRMSIVILADISNEIVLREHMKAAKIEGSPLDEGIPEKIKRLKDKGKVVFEDAEIINTRELRNGIVHRGDIPDRNQTKKALQIAQSVLNWCLKE